MSKECLYIESKVELNDEEVICMEQEEGFKVEDYALVKSENEKYYYNVNVIWN